MDRILAERGPAGIRLGPVEWASTFRVHRRICTRFQHGRVFLVGDAAHVHSPAGGQGLNTGVQDAHHLATAMAAVAHGRAGEELLGSYTRWRKPVVRRVVREADLQNRLWLLRCPAAVTARDVAVRLADRAGLLRRYARVLANRSAGSKTNRPAGSAGRHTV
ncbi:FAD-dependent oxidoreductase [Phytohabitans houttuyneae]|nr:FAD-dependent monooxygenase [Phytohabitans houttuyneae]